MSVVEIKKGRVEIRKEEREGQVVVRIFFGGSPFYWTQFGE